MIMDSPSNIGGGTILDEDHDHHGHDDQVEVPLPGFRFHPTDEELVGFYLRRKVDKKPITIQLIKPIDIYKYDPWDLPSTSCSAGDKEWYFFCKRGRKYKNSIRPNRVTGSGFWKATGIDKPVHSHGGDYGQKNQCIGLKKTLVYYRGSAGKGTKTDWMMHEFRLPTINDNYHNITNIHPACNTPKADPQEAEIWTLCRIFKRNMSYRRYTPDWRELSTKRHHPMDAIISSKKCSNLDHSDNNNNITTNREANHNYIDFSTPIRMNYHEDHQEKKPVINHTMIMNNNGISHHDRTSNQLLHAGQLNSNMVPHNYNNHNIINVNPSINPFSSCFSTCPDEISDDQLFTRMTNTTWDELSAVVELALDPAFE
ncbi:transcription factor JUNGBRUNNEN 1 isoform X2 [Morus notabilis]|uniref:transcription factor JUNGBRUNNEN 1 isoform X2 n=1 Tax=Morus notabilis TaxID=981085 RepID=UPI000CED58CC|nr:transcription factor JUNGBRUNNEN 1 isoform X2 [Morus notabilis]